MKIAYAYVNCTVMHGKKTLIRCNFEFTKRNDEKDENSLQDQSLFEVVFALSILLQFHKMFTR